MMLAPAQWKRLGIASAVVCLLVYLLALLMDTVVGRGDAIIIPAIAAAPVGMAASVVMFIRQKRPIEYIAALVIPLAAATGGALVMWTTSVY